MADINFIEFGTAPFFIERPSIFIEHYKVRGVHLLPNNTYPYIQTTNVSGGVELEDWTVYVVDSCGNETDVSAYFVIEEIFADDNGDNQFTWSLTNVPFDFGHELVHLKAEQAIGETFYSNYFVFTEDESDYTCRIDYRSYDIDTMQSIQLRLAYKQPKKEQELRVYYETSTKNTVTNTIKSQKYEEWQTDLISNDLLIKISDVFEYKYTYVNFIRCNLFNATGVQDTEAAENFAENIIKLSFNNQDTYDPLNPVEPEALIPSIVLESVLANGINATYTFTYANFVPTFFVFEYSDDEVNWVSENSGTISPIVVSFAESNIWYFRIRHPLAVSNTITVDLGNTVVANDDTFYVEQGATIDIDVLFNDVLVNTTTITLVGTPTNGTAVIIESGTKIRYTHDGSANLTDAFTYTISNGVTNDTATVGIVVENGTAFLMSNGGALGFSWLNFIGVSPDTTRYHNGDGAVPSVGDYVFTDQLLLNPFNGLGLIFLITGGRWIQIDGVGRVAFTGFIQ